MTTPDWFADCRTIFNRHPCPILSGVGAFFITILLWYANRIETKTEDMQESLNQIEYNVGILIDRQPVRQLAPGTIAQGNVEQ
jgi:hypothetical protein